MHIDDFIDQSLSTDKYARWFFFLHRLPSVLQMDFSEWIDQHRLYCIWRGNAYRVTGASRMGDVWLTSNFERDTGYEHRVDVGDCSDWSPTPPRMNHDKTF